MLPCLALPFFHLLLLPSHYGWVGGCFNRLLPSLGVPARKTRTRLVAGSCALTAVRQSMVAPRRRGCMWLAASSLPAITCGRSLARNTEPRTWSCLLDHGGDLAVLVAVQCNAMPCVCLSGESICVRPSREMLDGRSPRTRARAIYSNIPSAPTALTQQRPASARE